MTFALAKKDGKALKFNNSILGLLTTLGTLCFAGGEEPKHKILQFDKVTERALDYFFWVNQPLRNSVENPELMAVERWDFGIFNEVQDERPTLDHWEDKNPMAFGALKLKLFEKFKLDAFQKVHQFVAGQKWGHDGLHVYQSPEVLYLKKNQGNVEYWVEVQLDFPQNTWTDQNGDGKAEFFAKIPKEFEPPKTILPWLVGEYSSKEFSLQEAKDWGQVLASYWYPIYNTDLLPLEGNTWPSPQTEPEVKQALGESQIQSPFLVMRGNPHGEVIYNVVGYQGYKEELKQESNSAQSKGKPKSIDPKHQSFVGKERNTLGDWKASEEFNRRNYEATDTSYFAQEGKEGWLFFRGGIEYWLQEDLTKQQEKFDPISKLIEFHQLLKEQGIDFLVVPIPDKVEVESDSWNEGLSSTKVPHPYRQISKALLDAGVHVMDILPTWQRWQKENPGKHLFQKQDTHWNHIGLGLMAEKLNEKVRAYSWYKDLKPNVNRYSLVDTSFVRLGDLPEKLPVEKQGAYQPLTQKAQQVLREGKPYRGSRKDPISLIGDSFTGVFERVDVKSAGVGAHLAQKTGLDVDIITSWGGAPNVRNRFVRIRKKDKEAKRLVIFMITARDFYHYSQEWKSLELPKEWK